jgi:hypothetical protein
LKEVKESMSKQCLIEPKNNYNDLVFRPGAGWPDDLTGDTLEIKNLKATFRAVFSAQIEKCARNFRPERFRLTFGEQERRTFWVDWNNAWRDAQKPGQLREPGFKIEEELERIFKDMESYLYRVFDEMMRAEMEVIARYTATSKIMEPSKDIKFKVIQEKLAMDRLWNGKIRRDVLCRFEEDEKDDATESELGADDAAAAQLVNEANQPRGNGVRLSEKEVEVYRTVLHEIIAVLETSKYRLPNEPCLTFPEFEMGELDWVREYKRKLQSKYRRTLSDLAKLIGDAFFQSLDHSVFWTYVKNWSDRFEDTRQLYTPGPLERKENIYELQQKIRKLDLHMSTFLRSYYNCEFTKQFREICAEQIETRRLRDNTMWFQVRLRESREEDIHHLHLATHLPEKPALGMVLDRRWDDIFSDYIDPDYDFDVEDDGDMEPANIDELPHVFNGVCTIKRDGKMKHQTLIEEEEPKEDEFIEIDSDEDAPQSVVPEGGKRKRGRPGNEETAAKRRRLSNSGRDEALLDGSTRGRAPQRSDDALRRAYRERAASTEFTDLDDDVVEALNPANDNDATIVVDSVGASSSIQPSNSNGANNHAAGPSRKRQNAGTNGFSGDGGDGREPKRPKKKELPADKVADDEDQPDPKDKGKGKEVDPIIPVKKKRGRPLGSRNKPKVPIPPNLVVNGNSNLTIPPELNRAGPTPPGYQPPPNPVPGPDDISDNTVLISSDRSLNSSSVRMDHSPSLSVNIPERRQYLTPGPLTPLMNPPGSIYPNQGGWEGIGFPFTTFGPPPQRQEEQQQRQQQLGNQSPQPPQQPCTRISPSHAGDNSSVPPQAGTAQNPIDLEQQPPPTSQRPTTNSPNPGTPNTFSVDRSQPGRSNMDPPQSSAPQPRQEDQQQSMNPNSPHQGIAHPSSAAPLQTDQSNTLRPHRGSPQPNGQLLQQNMNTNSPQQGIARPSPVVQPQTGRPNIIPPNPGSHQPRAPSQSPRPQLTHPRGMQSQINNILVPLGHSRDQFQIGRGEPLPSSMPPPQGSSLRYEVFPPGHTQAHAGPSDINPALYRILKQQAAGGSSRAQFGIQQQSPSPRTATYGPPWQQGGVRSPQTYSHVPPRGYFRRSTHQGQYYRQQPTQYYIQQGGTSHNTFSTVQGQSQPHTFIQQESPVQQGTRHLPRPPPPRPIGVSFQQFQLQQLQRQHVENQAAQYQAAVQHTRGFQSSQNHSEWIGDHVVPNPPLKRETTPQQAYLTPVMSRNPSSTFQGAPRETYGQQQSFTDLLNNAMQEAPPVMADSYENLVREGGYLP